MEKHGMAGRRKYYRTGLLTNKANVATRYLSLTIVVMKVFFAVFILLFSAAFISAQEQPQVLIYGTEESPVAGSTWVLTLLVDHSEPRQVDVRPPPFIGYLLLEQVLVTPRLINPATGQAIAAHLQGRISSEQEAAFERWTAIEYRFLVYNPGIIEFEAFTVITPLGRTETEPFEIEVESAPDTVYTRRYSLAWSGMPPSLRTGESAVFSLFIRGWQQSRSLPDVALFLPVVPQGHILDSLPVSTEERLAGMALKLRLIPIDATIFTLQRRQFSYDGSIFEIPALRIPVSRAVRTEVSIPIEAVLEADVTADGSTARLIAFVEDDPPFPSLETAATAHARLYHRFRVESTVIYHTARDWWEKGNYAQALVTLRQNERDHGAGALFAFLRREAENTLGFFATGNERRPLPFVRRTSHIAVLTETPIRNIPDHAGEAIGLFREGQPVFVPSGSIPNGQVPGRRETWLRVTASDSGGATGWVPAANIIFY